MELNKLKLTALEVRKMQQFLQYFPNCTYVGISANTGEVTNHIYLEDVDVIREFKNSLTTFIGHLDQMINESEMPVEAGYPESHPFPPVSAQEEMEGSTEDDELPF